MGDPIRILHVVQRMEAGGTQALLMNIYRNIDRSKVQFDFLVEYDTEEFYDNEIRELGGNVYYTTIRQDFNIFKFKRKLKEVLKNNYKIMHVHASNVGYICFKEAEKYGIKIRIAHAHNNSSVHDSKYFLRSFLRKIYVNKANYCIACSKEAGEFFFKNKEFYILNNAIDAKKFIFNNEIRNKKKEELNLNNSFVVGHVGRLHDQKNHSFLLDIFFEVKKLKENSKLMLIGNGPLEDKILEKAKSMGIYKDVILLKNRNDVNELLQCMDVFILPSLFEGLGIVSIESQASGTPILCSDTLPKEVEISNLIKKMSLNEPAVTWAENAIRMSESDYCHSNMYNCIVNNNFDISCTVNNIMEKYVSLVNAYYDNHK